MRQIPYIMFSPKYMQVKNMKRNRPLYYVGYLGLTKVNKI